MAVDLSVLSEMVPRNVRLILPSVGAFFVKELESGFRVENVTFSTFLRYDDGKLTELLAQAKGLSTAEAAQLGEAMCKHIAAQLANSGMCVLPGLGALKQYPDGQIEFVGGNAAAAPMPSATATATAVEVQPAVAETPAVKTVEEVKAAPQGAAGKGEAKVAAKETVQSRAQRKQQRPAPRPVAKPQPAVRRKPPQKPKSTTKASGGAKTGGFVKFVLVLLCLVVVAAAADFLWFGWVSAGLFPGTAPYLKVRTERKLQAANQAALVAEGKAEGVDALHEGDANASEGDDAASMADQSSLEEEFKERTFDRSATNSPESTPKAETVVPQQNQRSEEASYSSQPAYSSSGQDATSLERGYGLPSESNTYHVVVGSFYDRDNADRFNRKLRLRGFASGIIDQASGHNAVTVGSFTTRSAAVAACGRFKDRFPDAWVLEY